MFPPNLGSEGIQKAESYLAIKIILPTDGTFMQAIFWPLTSVERAAKRIAF
jgi:hypothetical protein